MSIKFEECPNCKQYPSVGDYMRGGHSCAPLFHCQFDWQKEEGDEPARVFADNERDAAKKFVERWDVDDSCLTETAIVIVTNTIERKSFQIEVSGEVLRSYSAMRSGVEEVPYIDPYGEDEESEEPEGEEVES